MNPKELLVLGRRLYHSTPDVPSSRIRIAVTQVEWDALNEYMTSTLLIVSDLGKPFPDFEWMRLKICGIKLVIDYENQ